MASRRACAGRTQITPDLWVLIPLGNNTAVWHAVEYERSATTYESIEKKLRPYIVAHQLGEAWPMLMVCDTPDAARIVAEVAERNDLPLLVGTMDEVMRSPWSGSDSPWRLVGKTVAIDHLRNLAMWNRDKATRMNYVLRERTDVRL